MVSPENGESAVSGLWLSRIATEAPVKNNVLGVILVILAVLGAATGIFFLVRWFRKNYVFVKE